MHEKVIIEDFGEFQGIILLQEILNHLKVTTGDIVYLLLNNKNDEIVLSSKDMMFNKQLSTALDCMERYKETLAELAKK